MDFTNEELRETLSGKLVEANKLVAFYQKIIEQLDNGYTADMAKALEDTQPLLDEKDVEIAKLIKEKADLQAIIDTANEEAI